VAVTETSYAMNFIGSIAAVDVAWLQASSRTSAWYNGALLVAAVTAAATFAAGQFSAWRTRVNRRNALLAAFVGETAAIRGEVRDRLVMVREDLAKTGQVPFISEILEPIIPIPVFRANVGSIGETGDTKVAADIARLYVRIEFINRLVQVIVAREDALEREGDRGEDITVDGRAGYFGLLSWVLTNAGEVERELLELLKDPRGNTIKEQEAEDAILSAEISNLLDRSHPL
jgi:hypothetical protein